MVYTLLYYCHRCEEYLILDLSISTTQSIYSCINDILRENNIKCIKCGCCKKHIDYIRVGFIHENLEFAEMLNTQNIRKLNKTL